MLSVNDDTDDDARASFCSIIRLVVVLVAILAFRDWYFGVAGTLEEYLFGGVPDGNDTDDNGRCLLALFVVRGVVSASFIIDG